MSAPFLFMGQKISCPIILYVLCVERHLRKKRINAYWSKLWVQQRIVPTDRQNLGQVLKENGLSEYDEFELLMLAEGRCAQDSYFLAGVLPERKDKAVLRHGHCGRSTCF